ncbi:MAG: T9SS type A sorting domain-containing protein [Bacteroidales bacterium]|jgi:hypothetical protein
MKRFTLVLLFLGTMVTSFGQVLQNCQEVPFWEKSPDTQSVLPIASKGGGDIIWQTSFNWADPSDPRGWSLPDGWIVQDNSDYGNLWIWRNDTLKGLNTVQPAPSFFVTGGDGFIAVPMAEYNRRDGVTTAIVSDTYIQTPPINCSSVSSVVVKFSQYFRLCCNNYNLEMLVTIDGGTHWATFDVRHGIMGNTYTPDRFQNVEINITEVAAGMSNVQIRFYMHGMAYYFWMIDDLSLSEAYDNDLVLEDYWIGWDEGDGSTAGHINYWPLSQMGMPGSTTGTIGQYHFWGALQNNGNYDQENANLKVEILKNGASIVTDNSPSMPIWSLQRDTLNVVNPWLATDYGDYRIIYTAVSDNSEEVPKNNTVTLPFTVNDTLAHRADFTAESSANTVGWTGGSNAGDMVGVKYDIHADCEINSITAYLTSFVATQSPQFQFVLMKEIDGSLEEWLTSATVDMDSSYSYKWVTLPLVKDGEHEFLSPGKYATFVRMWSVDPTDPTNGNNGLSVGWDMTTKQSNTIVYLSVGGTWYEPKKLNMIGFNIKASGGPTQAPVTFNVDLNKHIQNGEFHPGTDKVDVFGVSSTWNGTADMTDPEGDGIYTVTVDGMSIGKIIEYKYRINGLEEAYAFSGGPYRKYTVRYWNILNNTYNNGVTTGLITKALTASINIFPNPANGRFTVSITNIEATDMTLELINTSGQVVYRNEVKAAYSNNAEISTSQFDKGVYYLKVKQDQKVKVEKVIIQ